MTIIQKQASPELLSLIVRAGELVERYEHVAYEAKDLVKKIKEKAKVEGFGAFEIALLAREVLKDKFSPAQLGYWFPIKKNNVLDENKEDKNDVEKDTEQKKNWDEEVEDIIKKEVPVKDSTQFYKEQTTSNYPEVSEEEDAKDIEITFLKERVQQLEDALHKTEQFKVASISVVAGPTPEEDDVNSVKVRAGIGAIENLMRLEIPKLKNRGWKTVEITMRAV